MGLGSSNYSITDLAAILDATGPFRHHTPMSDTWTAKFADEKKRLDVFLAEKVAGLSRAQAKKRIKEGDVITENREPGTGSRKKVLDRIPAPGSQFPVSDLHILEESPDWIVVYKPAGVLMHPDSQHPDGTLIDSVIAHAPQVVKIGEDPIRPGIVSRLDKDVSGLVVIDRKS